jgi:HEAT repeat protein
MGNVMDSQDAFDQARIEVKNRLANLRKQTWLEQLEAIEALTNSADPLADVVLFQLLDLRTPEVRGAAMRALATRSEALGRIAARALLGDTNAVVRDEAATILGEMGSRLDVRRLRQALTDDYWVLRATVADSLGQIGGKAVHPALLHAMTHDPHPVVRRDAAFALTYARSSAVVPDLERAAATEKAEQARIGLLSALVALGRGERLPELLALLESEDCAVRHATINYLRESVGPEEREQAVHAIRAMIEHEENPGVKIDATLVLNEISGNTRME